MKIESSNDPRAFAEFEHRGWEAVSRGYEQHFSRLTRQSVTPLLDAARVDGDCRVLDVATGPGMIAAAAVARNADTLGLDFAAEVIEIARANVPGAEFLVGDAQDMHFDDDSFDAVVCGFGIIHVPNPEQALAEMHRVLKPGGRVAVSVWEAPNPANGFGLLYGSIQAHGVSSVDLPHGPDFFQFSGEASLAGALNSVGFAEPVVSAIPQFWELVEADGLVNSFVEGSVRGRGLLAAQPDVNRQAIFEAIRQGMEMFRSEEGIYRVPMPALIGSATR